MAIHYLFDFFNPTLAASKINDVHAAKDGTSLCVGNFIVRIPGEIQIDNPTSLPDLITQKHQGLLAYFTGFQHIAYDDLLDTTGVDISNSAGKFGTRGTIAVGASGGQFQSLPVTLTVAPAQVLIVWETFTYIDNNPPDDRFLRAYAETNPDTLTCQVSFNGGTNWITGVTDGGVVNVPVAYRGTNFLIRFANSTGAPVNLGSWSVIY